MAEKEKKDTNKTAKEVAEKKATPKKEQVKKDETKTTSVKNETTKKQTTSKEPKKEEKKFEKPKGKVTVETKKVEKKNNKEASEKNSGKKIAGIVIVIAIIAIVAVLTFLIVTSSDPKKSIDGYLTNLKSGDFEKAQEFAAGGDILSNNEYDKEVQKLLFDKISWKVKEVKTENDSATVEIEITNKNFEEIVQNCMKKMLTNFKAVLGGTLTTQDIGKYFEEELRNENIQTKTVTGTIKLEKQDKKWKVVVDQELGTILLPGLENSMNYIQ